MSAKAGHLEGTHWKKYRILTKNHLISRDCLDWLCWENRNRKACVFLNHEHDWGFLQMFPETNDASNISGIGQHFYVFEDTTELVK